MSVVPLRPARNDNPINLVPAIRTPDQYREAQAQVEALMEPNSIRQDLAGKPIDAFFSRILEIGNILRAMDESPFTIRNGEVVSRGACLSIVH